MMMFIFILSSCAALFVAGSKPRLTVEKIMEVEETWYTHFCGELNDRPFLDEIELCSRMNKEKFREEYSYCRNYAYGQSDYPEFLQQACENPSILDDFMTCISVNLARNQGMLQNLADPQYTAETRACYKDVIQKYGKMDNDKLYYY